MKGFLSALISVSGVALVSTATVAQEVVSNPSPVSSNAEPVAKAQPIEDKPTASASELRFSIEIPNGVSQNPDNFPIADPDYSLRVTNMDNRSSEPSERLLIYEWKF